MDGIENRVIKFKLQRGGASMSMRDKNAEALVKSQLGDEGQTVSRRLFQDKSGPVYQYHIRSGEMYVYHVNSTLPYGDDGTRLLKNSEYFNYTTAMSGFISDLEQLKQAIVSDAATYDAVVHADIYKRNAHLLSQGKPATAVRSDYLSLADMTDRLYVKWYPEPLSTSGDFRFEVPDDMKQAYDNNVLAMVKTAKSDIIRRMLEPMQAFVDKMAVPIGETGAVFRDTLVTNLTQLVAILPGLNIDDDAEIHSAIDRLKTATDNLYPDALRNSQGMRDKAKADMTSLVDALTGGWRI